MKIHDGIKAFQDLVLTGQMTSNGYTRRRAGLYRIYKEIPATKKEAKHLQVKKTASRVTM